MPTLQAKIPLKSNELLSISWYLQDQQGITLGDSFEVAVREFQLSTVGANYLHLGRKDLYKLAVL